MPGLRGQQRIPHTSARERRNSDNLANRAEASANDYGVVKQQTNIPDIGVLTDSSGGTSGGGTIGSVTVTVTDPADSPATADALRDDLVANTIPSIESNQTEMRDAIATLAAYCTSLEDKINAMLAAQQAADQMASS